MAVLVVVGGLVAALVLAHLAARAQSMAQAQTAADAAALAALPDDRDAARRLASANGAVLEEFAATDGMVRVEVTVGGERAVAAAMLPASAVSPALAAALDRVAAVLGQGEAESVRPLGPLGSGGIEVTRHLAARLAQVSHLTGLCRAVDGRPLHFVLCPAINR